MFQSIWAGVSFTVAYAPIRTSIHSLKYAIGLITATEPNNGAGLIYCFESLEGAKFAYGIREQGFNKFRRIRPYSTKKGRAAILECEAISVVHTHYCFSDECRTKAIIPVKVVWEGELSND